MSPCSRLGLYCLLPLPILLRVLRTTVFAVLPSYDFATLVRLLKFREKERDLVVWAARAGAYLLGAVVATFVVILIVGGGGGSRREGRRRGRSASEIVWLRLLRRC